MQLRSMLRLEGVKGNGKGWRWEGSDGQKGTNPQPQAHPEPTLHRAAQSGRKPQPIRNRLTRRSDVTSQGPTAFAIVFPALQAYNLAKKTRAISEGSQIRVLGSTNLILSVAPHPQSNLKASE